MTYQARPGDRIFRAHNPHLGITACPCYQCHLAALERRCKATKGGRRCGLLAPHRGAHTALIEPTFICQCHPPR